METKINDLVNLRIKILDLVYSYYGVSSVESITDIAKKIENYITDGMELPIIKDDTDKFMEILTNSFKTRDTSLTELPKLPPYALNVKIKKLTENAVIPTYAKPGDAGLDFTATSYEYKPEIDCHVFGTGLALEIPEGYVGLCFPRSSNRKTDLYLTNSVGVIDSGYRGEVMASFKTRDFNPEVIAELKKGYEVGDRVFQMIILPYPKVNFVRVDELSTTERGEGGHGSTGK